MPPKTSYPTPSLRFHNGAWKIIWNLAGKQYSVSTGLPEKDKLFAEKRRIEFEIALKNDAPAFPSEYRHASSVSRYIETRYGVEGEGEAVEDDSLRQWLRDYATDTVHTAVEVFQICAGINTK